MRALTGLRKAGLVAQKSHNDGRPAEMQLKKIHADLNNSRRPEDEGTAEGIEAQAELTRDIEKRGVKSPVSLRPHPNAEGEYILNFGHRRLKGALEAGLETIPYFLDVNFDSYDQMKENLLHRRPSVWALAQFVQCRLSEGQSKAEIAEGLGKTNQNLVTELQALVDAPICLHQAYANGVTSTRTLYDLRRAYDEFPEQVETWCASGAMITRVGISERLKALREVGSALDLTSDAANRAAVTDQQAERSDDRIGLYNSPGAGDKTEAADHVAAVTSRDGVSIKPEHVPQLHATPELRHDVKISHASEGSKATSTQPKASTTTREIVVEYQGRKARIAQDATIKIVMEGRDTVLEVPASELIFSETK